MYLMEIFFVMSKAVGREGRLLRGKEDLPKHIYRGNKAFLTSRMFELIAKASLPPPSLKALMTDRLTDRLNRQLRGKSIPDFRHIGFNFFLLLYSASTHRHYTNSFFFPSPLANMQIYIYVLYIFSEAAPHKLQKAMIMNDDDDNDE